MRVLALDLIIVMPLALAALAWLAGRRYANAPRWLALAGSLGQLGLLVYAGGGALRGGTVLGARLPVVGGFWQTVLDGLSAPMVALTALIGVIAVLASWRIADRPGSHHALLLLLQGALAGVFLSDNLLMFYVAWESVLVPMFLLIAGWGSAGARRAAYKFLLYTFAGGAVLLAGIIYVLFATNTASIAALSGMSDSLPSASLAFWLLAVGFLVKVPAVPFHTWLPDAHTEAPTAGSIVLAGVMLKMGGYGLMRIALPLAPAGWEQGRVVLAALGLIGIVWGAAAALVQTDLKRLVAYSSVAHMGFVVLALSVGTPAAMGAALMTMLSHGFVAGLLFFLVGSLYGRAHTRELSRFGGLGTTMPGWSSAFVFAALASAGLPALSGFPGEFVSLIEGFSAWGWWMLVAGLGIALSAAYNLRAVRGTVQGPQGAFAEKVDLDRSEWMAVALLSVCIVALGVRPDFVLAVASRTLETISSIAGAL